MNRAAQESYSLKLKTCLCSFLLLMGITCPKGNVCAQKSRQPTENIVLENPSDFLIKAAKNPDLFSPDSLLWFKARAFETLVQKDSSQFYYNRALTKARQLKDTTKVLRAYVKLAWFTFEKGRYEKSLHYYTAAYAYVEHTQDCARKLKFLHSIAIMQYYLKRNEAFKIQLKKVVIAAKKCADSTILAETYSSLGVKYIEENMADSAIYFLNQSLKINKIRKNRSAYAHEIGILGDVYLNLKKNRNKAIALYQEAEAILEKTYPGELAFLQLKIGRFYLEEGHYLKAKTYADTALNYYRSEGLKDGILRGLKLQISLAKAKQNVRLLDQLYSELVTIQDTIYKNEVAKVYAETELKFETALKDKELSEKELQIQQQQYKLKIIELDNRRRQNKLYLFYGLFVAFSIGIVLYFKWKRQRHKIELDRLLLLEQEKSLNAMLEAQESERRRIGRDLHDGVCQSIGALKMKQLSLLQKEKSEREAEWLNSITELGEIYEEVRLISHRQMPQVLQELGLGLAIYECLVQLCKSAEIEYEMCNEFPEDLILPDPMAASIYRIAQELMMNSIKHAQAQKLEVQLYVRNQSILLNVYDDGKGFALGTKNKGIGLINIQTRVDLLGGGYEMETSPGKGSFARIRVPLT